MNTYHHDFWLAVAAAGPLIALAVVEFINRYFTNPIWKERIKAEAQTQRRTQATRAAGTVLLYNIVAWIGFGATAVATVIALLALAWERDVIHPVLAIVPLVIAGATLPVLGLITTRLRRQLSHLEMTLDDLR